MNKIIITKENFNFLVKKEFQGYYLSCYVGIPRKGKKGGLGYKNKNILSDLRIFSKEKAEKLFYNLKEEYLTKLIKKEIILLRLYLYPHYQYKVKCPVCGKDAQILTFVMCSWIGDNFGSPIACKHCWTGDNSDYWWMNEVGICEYLDISDEEKEIIFEKQYHNENIKWDDFIKNPNILEWER